jgi:hypothetical protein
MKTINSEGMSNKHSSKGKIHLGSSHLVENLEKRENPT